jgi:hypothetical protein
MFGFQSMRQMRDGVGSEAKGSEGRRKTRKEEVEAELPSIERTCFCYGGQGGGGDR